MVVRRDQKRVVLPRLVDLDIPDRPASVNWVEIPNAANPTGFDIDPLAVASIDLPMSPENRYQMLASSVMQAIAASSDALADRRDEEVATWLRPWITRYRQLCQAVGRRIGDDAPDSESQPSSSVGESSAVRRLGGEIATWEEMDTFILAQETRYFSEESAALDVSTVASLDRLGSEAGLNGSDFLAVSRPPGYSDRWTFQWQSDELPLAILARQRSPLNEELVQHMILAGLFVALSGLFIVPIVLPRRRAKPIERQDDASASPSVRSPMDASARSASAPDAFPFAFDLGHPAVWLFVLGLIGLLLIPIPVSLGLMFAAVILGGSDRTWRTFQKWRHRSRV